MFEYYDSDEDVYWGPVTLKEKKRNLLRKVAPEFIKDRSSIGCDPTFANDQSKRYEDIISTKNQLLRTTDMSGSQNFIEKVAEVLEVTAPTDSSYFTAKDYVIRDENENRGETFTIAPSNISATFYTLPVHSSKNIDDSTKIGEATKNNISTDSSTSVDDIVNISSDLNDSLLDHSLNMKEEVFSENTTILIEEDNSNGELVDVNYMSDSDGVDTYSDLDNSLLDQSLKRKDSLREEQVVSEDDTDDIHEDHYRDLIKTDEIDILTSSEESLSEVQIHHMINHNNLEVIEELDEDGTQLSSIPKIQITTSSGRCRSDGHTSDYVENSNEESFKFNDTLEEIEKLLSQGSNYTMTPNKSSNKPDVLHKEDITDVSIVIPPKPTADTKKVHLTPNIPTRTPTKSTNNYTRKVHLTPNIPSRNITKPTYRTPNMLLYAGEKIPAKSTTKQCPSKSSTTPATKPSARDRFKNIQSPIATYIKNSGNAHLFKTVTHFTQGNKENLAQTSTKAHADNSLSFPELRYKPAKRKIIEAETFKLPKNISTLIPLKAKAAQHQKVGTKAISSRELVDGDLTTDGSINVTQDISILERRNVFI